MIQLFISFALGMALGGAIAFKVTADTYEDEVDRIYRENLDDRHTIANLEDTIDALQDEIDRLNLRPVHCPAPVRVTQIGIDWNELDFPNSQEAKNE